MKHNTLTQITILLTIGFLTTFALAQSGPDSCARGDGTCEVGKAGGPGHKNQEARCEKMMKRLVKVTSPTDKQKQQIDQILDTHRQAMKNFNAENRDKLAAARKTMKANRQGRQKLRKELLAQLAGVLNKEQMEKAEKVMSPDGRRRRGRGGRFGKGPGRRGRGRGMGFKELNLTDKQHEQIKDIMKDARSKAETAKGKDAKREIFKAARKKVRDEVFTDAQRTKAKELRKKYNPLMGIATDEQLKESQKIMEAAREKARNAKTREERRDIMITAREKVRNEILTEDQRKKLEGKRKQRRAEMRDKMATRLGMTEEQKSKSKKIMDDARTQAKKAKTHEEKRDIMTTAWEKIRDEVLTEEQREKSKKLNKWRRGGPGRGPRRGPHGGPGRGRGPHGGPDEEPPPAE